MSDAAYFPMFVDLSDKQIVVFGGGKVATRRTLALLEFGGDIKVVAPKCSEKVLELAARGFLRYDQRHYRTGEIKMPYMVLAATNHPEVNDMIYCECKEKGILVNTASEQTKSDFFFPGLAIEKPIVVGITTGGTDPKQTKRITEKIREILKGKR